MTSRAQAAAVALAVFVGGGCFVTEPVGALRPVQDLPPRVRIYRYNGDTVDLHRSRIEADTIRGYRFDSTTEIRVPLAHVDSMTHRRLHRRDTAVFTAVLTFLAVRKIQSGVSKLD